MKGGIPMENPFKETKEYFNIIRQLADTDLLYRQKKLLGEELEEKKKTLLSAPDRQTHKIILAAIEDLEFEVMDKERSIQIAKTQRKAFFRDEEKARTEALYNKEITALIKRYDTLIDELEHAITTFGKAVEGSAGEMLAIEDEVLKMTEIRMKLGKVKNLPIRKHSLYTELLTRGSKVGAFTFPGVVLTKLMDLKSFVKK